MKRLSRDLKGSNQSAFAEGTRKNLRVQWESFLMFCLYFGLKFLPANTMTLQLFVQFLSRSFKSVSSIRNYLSGIRTVHLLLGFDLDDINNNLLNISLRGISRLKQHCVHQAEAITPELLSRMFYVMDMQNYENSVYWCLFLFAFFLVARKSNLVPTTKMDVVNSKCLLHRDVVHFGSYLEVTMNWSKVIQYGERKLVTPLLRLPGSRLCPVSAYERMIAGNVRSPDSPLFVSKSKVPVTYDQFQGKLRSVLSKLDLDVSKYSTHSFRRGFATFAFRNNVSADEIQILGDWHSDVYKRYISLSVKDKLDIVNSVKEKFYFD